jgi:ribosomal protein L11 methyltransferase
VAVLVGADIAEEARARMLEAVPEGFEEIDHGDTVELAGYVDDRGERRLRKLFGNVLSEPVAADWEDRWRSFHHGVRIGPLWVGPTWEPASRDAIAVVIDPGRAFGTGAHATTRLSLKLLLELERGSLVDVGCGSGVIAIAAAKLGYRVVEAVDIDSVAAATAAANAARNGVALPVRTADALADRIAAADVAVANIALEVTEELVPRLDADWFVTSGYLETQRPGLARVAHVGRRTAEGWAADLYRRH